MMATSYTPPAKNTKGDGTGIYSKQYVQYIYDWFVLWLSNSYAWRCPTTAILLPLFKSTMGARHLDIGVGSGNYPSKALAAGVDCKEITIVDLNTNSLAATEKRIIDSSNAVRITTVVADAAEHLPLPGSARFDSISMFYLLHCVPGPQERKVKAFDVVRDLLAPGGVLVGSTILGREQPMNWIAAKLMSIYNNSGTFDNWNDRRHVFEEALRKNFEEVSVRLVGRVMLFTARKPRSLESDAGTRVQPEI